MKEFLHQKGVAFEEKDVSRDESALDALLAMGFQATPVTVIDGEAVVGFNKPKLEQLLAKSTGSTESPESSESQTQ